MKEYTIKVDFEKGQIENEPIILVQNDYNSTKFKIEFDKEYENYTKKMTILFPDNTIYQCKIENNEFVLVGHNNDNEIVSLINQEGEYQFNFSLYDNDSKLTTTENSYFLAKDDISNREEVQLDDRLPILDDLINDVNKSILETNNLDIDIEDSIVTIIKKDGTIKRENVKGDKGEKGDAGAIKVLKVNELPTEDIKDDTIYLVPMPVIEVETLPLTGQMYTIYVVISTQKRYRYVSGQWVETLSNDNNLEYIHINNKWELVGQADIEIDLTDYVKNTDYATSSKGGVVKTSNYYDTELDSSGALRSKVVSYAGYSNESNNAFISKGTLENVIEGKGLVSNNNFATQEKGGVVKVWETIEPDGSYTLNIATE